MRAAHKRLVVLGVVAGGLIAAYALGALDVFADTERTRAALDRWGGWGYALYVIAFVALEPFVVPAFVFVIAASALWPAGIVFALSYASGMGASLIGFFVARYVARDWVAARLPARFHRFDERIERHGFTATVVIRLTFFLVPPTHWVLGLSRVRLRAYIAGTAIGALPWFVTFTFLGHGLIDWLRSL